MSWADTIFASRAPEPLEFECSGDAARCVPVIRRAPRVLYFFGHLLYRAPSVVSTENGTQCVSDLERATFSARRAQRLQYADAWESVRKRNEPARWERLCRRWAGKHPMVSLEDCLIQGKRAE